MPTSRRGFQWIDLMMPSIGVRSKEPGIQLGIGVGLSLLAFALICNYWMIERVFAPDGHIESTVIRVFIWTVEVFLVLVGAFIVKYPVYGGTFLLVFLPCLSIMAVSFLFFGVLEVFPSLITYMPFSQIHYYQLKFRYIPDDELVFRNRPSSRFVSGSFKGDHYQDSYGVEIQPLSYSARYDEHGFRNISTPHTGWDVVVLGDSYIEFGLDEDDTFSSRLGALSGLKVRNLGTAAHGPFQYMTVLKRYGLVPKPTYVLFSFFEGNDITDIRQYLRWKEVGEAYGTYNLTAKNFVQRYVMALAELSVVSLAQVSERLSQASTEARRNLHPDLVLLNMGDVPIKTVFSYQNDPQPAPELVKMSEWIILKKLLVEIKAICAENNIVPIVVFIPTKAHIYAEYTSPHSGTNWMTIRDQQIASKDNVETALRALSREAGIELISLSPAFEQAAKQGRFLYYPFDTHWNSEGRQVAASVIAEILSSHHGTSRAFAQ